MPYPALLLIPHFQTSLSQQGWQLLLNSGLVTNAGLVRLTPQDLYIYLGRDSWIRTAPILGEVHSWTWPSPLPCWPCYLAGHNITIGPGRLPALAHVKYMQAIPVM